MPAEAYLKPWVISNWPTNPTEHIKHKSPKSSKVIIGGAINEGILTISAEKK